MNKLLLCTVYLVILVTLPSHTRAVDTLDFELKPAGIEQSVEHEAVSEGMLDESNDQNID